MAVKIGRSVVPTQTSLNRRNYYRWYISKGQIDKAVDIMRRFERINRRTIPENVMDDFIYTVKNEEKEHAAYVKQPVFRYILTMLILSFMSVALLFDGLIRLSETLGMDFFITFTITSATEIPAIAALVLLLDRFGRRKMVFVPMMLSAVITLVIAFIPRGVASVTLAVTARFLNNMAYGTIIQWTPELMPTAVRAFSASIVHMSGFCAVIVTPFMVYSERVWLGLPLVIMTVVAAVGSSLALLLPETLGRAMPQTEADWLELAYTRPFQKTRKTVPTASGT